MKMNFYKYVLMAMAFLVGFHLYDMIVTESVILYYTIEYSEFPELFELVTDMRLMMNFSNMMTFLVCIGLFFIAIGLYLVEFYTCKYINKVKELKTKSKI